jgi:hypothetical protein
MCYIEHVTYRACLIAAATELHLDSPVEAQMTRCRARSLWLRSRASAKIMDDEGATWYAFHVESYCCLMFSFERHVNGLHCNVYSPSAARCIPAAWAAVSKRFSDALRCGTPEAIRRQSVQALDEYFAHDSSIMGQSL